MFNIQVYRPSSRSRLLNSLISYWTLNESSGERFDSNRINNLSDNNSVGSTSGKIDLCATFVSSSSQYLSALSNNGLNFGATTPSSNNHVDFTIACWAYLSSKSSQMAFVSKYNFPANKRQYILGYYNVNDRFYLGVSSDGTSVPLTDVYANNLGSPSTGTWYFVVAWHDSESDTLNIQINNGTVNSVSYSVGVYASDAPFLLGQAGSAVYMNGRIDEVGLWNRLLTSDERSYLYNQGVGRTYPFLPS